MNNPTPEEIKRHAIKFKLYFEEYVEKYKKSVIYRKYEAGKFPVWKSDDELYEDFVSGKPVSL